MRTYLQGGHDSCRYEAAALGCFLVRRLHVLHLESGDNSGLA